MDPSKDDRATWWTRQYRDDDPVPWETGRPQSRVVALAESGAIRGRVLDVGCGVGTEALYLADRGHSVVGVDFAPAAVDRARERATDRTVDGDARFVVADALALSAAEVGRFGTVLDVGMFHTLDPTDYRDYASSLESVLDPGGRVVFVEFGDGAPDDWGPNPVSAADVHDAFGDGWTVTRIEDATFETRTADVPGISAVIERTR